MDLQTFNAETMQLWHIRIPKTATRSLFDALQNAMNFSRFCIKSQCIAYQPPVQQPKVYLEDQQYIAMEAPLHYFLSKMSYSTNSIFKATLLRNPITHLVSRLEHPEFFVPDQFNHLHRITRMKGGIDEWLTLPKPPDCNTQCNYHLSDFALQHLKRRKYELMSKTLRNLPFRFDFIGIYEYFDTSICILMYQLGVFPPNRCTCASRIAKVEGSRQPDDMDTV